MNDRASYFISAFYFLAGALAGGVVALLVAPQAGKVTRAMMLRQLSDTAASARQLTDRVVHRGETLGEEAVQRVTDAASALAGHRLRKMDGPGGEAAPA